MGKKEFKIIHLKDYVKGVHGPLVDKIVVGSDIRPAQAVNLVTLNRPLQVVTDGFDEKKILSIKDDLDKFLKNPADSLIDLSPDNVMKFQKQFYATADKKDFMLEVESFLKTTKFRRVRDDIYLIADELFTNFTKSALDNKKPIEFGIHSNQDSVVIHCRDNYGTLQSKVMLENMQRCFSNGIKNAIKQDQDSGAGIGSFLIYSLGVGMVITVNDNKSSLVSVWMPRNVHHEDRIEMNKCLIVIEVKEA